MSKIIRKHIAVALMDQNHTMFIEKMNNPDDVSFVHKIHEHISRVLELSENQHIYMDYQTFVALGRSTIQNRFCRVFCKDEEEIKKVEASMMYRVHLFSELTNILETTSYYQSETLVFFLGQSKMLEKSFEYCSKLLLTVINAKVEIPEDCYHNSFPVEKAKYAFSKRKDIIPEMMLPITEYKKLKNSKKVERSYEIADNGMKIIKSGQSIKEENQQFDEIFDSPDYMFYEYNK